MSDTMAPDIMVMIALAVLLLVGLRILIAVAATGVAALLSTACFLYRRRRPS